MDASTQCLEYQFAKQWTGWNLDRMPLPDDIISGSASATGTFQIAGLLGDGRHSNAHVRFCVIRLGVMSLHFESLDHAFVYFVVLRIPN